MDFSAWSPSHTILVLVMIWGFVVIVVNQAVKKEWFKMSWWNKEIEILQFTKSPWWRFAVWLIALTIIVYAVLSN